MTPVIEALDIGKKYRIRHQNQPRYGTLRDTIAHTVAGLSKRLLAGRQRGEPGTAPEEYEEFWALRDISFNVNPGDRLAILGRNGAGKSTLLKVLSRITEPSCGTARVKGRVASLLEVGTGFHPELTGRENIFLNGAILGMTKADIQFKFDEIVSFAGIERFLDTPVKHYSSGMYMRLAFAIAAHLEPDILVVDEVLAVGDVDFQNKCLGKMASIGEEGRTLIFVSHNISAVERLCNSAMLLSGGRIAKMSADIADVVKGYIGDAGVAEHAEWTNSGDQYESVWFKPTRFGLVDASESPAHSAVRHNEDVWVRIEGNIRQRNALLAIGIQVYAEDASLVFQSYHTDRDSQTSTLGPGEWKFMLKIPAALLNEGSYKIELVAVLFDLEWIIEPRTIAPAISLVVKGGLVHGPYWTRKRLGVVAPVLDWRCVPTSTSASPD